MFKLLNRFAWILSIFAWIIISFIFTGWTYYVWLFVIPFIWIAIWMLFKKIFLSKDFIEERVKFFADALKGKTIPSSLHSEVLPLKKEEIKEKQLNTSHPAPLLTGEGSLNKKEEEYVPSQVEILFSWLFCSIKKFFSENILAKIWWILIFLSVLYFLSIIYSIVWDNLKILIWFVVWFAVYITWVILDKKWFKNEWKILLGVWILINYLVILSWRYLLWDSWYLSEWITLFFLVLNTIFAVVTSLVYKSRVLLIFSFIFAYINPFLIWGSSSDPYSLVIYSSLVSIWVLSLGVKQKE